MGKLIVVSNRVGPLRDTGKAGGLAVALIDVLRQRGGVWFGWSGKVSEEGTFSELRRERSKDVELATIDLSQADYEEFYLGYANRTLWPILHYRLDIAEMDRPFEQGYRRVNERFASRLMPLVGPDDTIWVHDYHFFPLAAQLRAMGARNRIGFFLHIPFPPPDILTALPRHLGFVRAMLAYDLIGFQTERDRKHFVTYLTEEAGGTDHGDGTVEAFGRRVRVGAFPIGIDTAGFRDFAVSPEARRESGRLSRSLSGRTQIVGVDRIDYSKGLIARFRGFERLLDNYPETRGQATFLQIAPPSRGDVDAYADIRRELEGLAGHVNGRFADIDWTPIRFITRAFPRKALAGIYRSSRVGYVTPFRDGMNLVAKEYVAAQDPEDPGILILSRFAGAMQEMREAIIVNPYSTEELAEALQTALRMPQEERTARHRTLYARLLSNDARSWANSFLRALAS
jgi:trehalose 6-phosphate synthase